MNAVIKAITDWPALAQLVVATGIFSALVNLVTKIYAVCATQVIKVSQNARTSRVGNELLRTLAYKAAETSDIQHHGMYAAVLWYRASRHLIKALIWLTLGLACNAFVKAFGVVGFLGCLYYLFSAFQVVRPFPGPFDADAKIQELEQRLAESQQKQQSQ